MNGIEKQAAFYRGYLPDDRSLVALTVLLSTTVTLWLLVYLMDVAGDALHAESSTCPGSAARVARAWNGKVFTDRRRGALFLAPEASGDSPYPFDPLPFRPPHHRRSIASLMRSSFRRRNSLAELASINRDLERRTGSQRAVGLF